MNHTAIRFGRLLLIPILLLAAQVRGQPAPTSAQAGTNATAPGLHPFSVQINDGLGRPVPGVTVEVFRFAKQTNGEETKLILGRAVSDETGFVSGQYDKASIPSNSTFLVSLAKAGYADITSAPQANFRLDKVFRSNDVATIAKLVYPRQDDALRELLAGEFDQPKTSLAEAIFAHDAEFRLGLKGLVGDQFVRRQAAEMLAYIGNPDDVRLLLGDRYTPNGDPAVNRWADAVASALLAPTTDREWSFLKSCAMDEFGDHWVDLAGIRTLRLIASPQSLRMLQDVRGINPVHTNEIDAAVAYINSHPAPLADRDPAAAAAKTAQALGDGLWMGNEPPRYNLKRDKALVDLNLLANGSRYRVYTATFHNDNGLWKLRGVRVTKDTLLPAAPAPKKAEAAK